MVSCHQPHLKERDFFVFKALINVIQFSLQHSNSLQLLSSIELVRIFQTLSVVKFLHFLFAVMAVAGRKASFILFVL